MPRSWRASTNYHTLRRIPPELQSCNRSQNLSRALIPFHLGKTNNIFSHVNLLVSCLPLRDELYSVQKLCRLKENRRVDDILHDNIYKVQEQINLINGDRMHKGGYLELQYWMGRMPSRVKKILTLHIHACRKVIEAVLFRLRHQMCVIPKKFLICTT